MLNTVGQVIVKCSFARFRIDFELLYSDDIPH
jgi:hypothetical protein